MLNSWVVTKALQRNANFFRMLWIGSFLGVTTEFKVVSRALTGSSLMVAILLLVSGC